MEQVIDKLKDISISIMIRKGMSHAGANFRNGQIITDFGESDFGVTSEQLSDAMEKVIESLGG